MPTPDELRQLGQLLRHRREELGLRKSEVARRIGVTPAYITLIERATPRRQGRGNPTQPRRDVLGVWALVLGLEEEETARVLGLGRHTVQPSAATGLQQVPPPDVPWPRRRELLMEQVSALLRLADQSPDRDALADLLTTLFDLIRFRLTHERPD